MAQPLTEGISRRDCLLASAGSLFAESGYDGTTIRQIARRCGITEAAIYKHFPSKESLYTEVIKGKARRHKISAALAAKRGEGTIEDVLFTVARHVLATASDDPELLRMLLYSSLEKFKAAELLYREFRLPYISWLREELRDRIESGELRKVDPFITARCFVGMVMDCAVNVELWNHLENTSFSTEDVVTNNVPVFAAGLLAT
ncbi:MAG: TetR/AcrR family transcriptional regulator [Candidatus Krumholzibacteriia bacterium]|nr:TetR/AcrR family transcriptional regulator [bacterium]MCB9516472.1 TetR/AcrR family transcriptional regulator [Candidatus Latescibacterota bacterium]